MKKTLKILLLAMITVLCAVCCVACDGGKKEETAGLKITKHTGDDFYTVYGYNDDAEVTVVDISEMAIVDGNKVEIGRISANAFAGAVSVKELIVPQTVVEIDEGAFSGMRSLEKLTLPFVGKTAVADAYYRETADADKSVDIKRTLGFYFGTESFDFGTTVTVTYAEGKTETRYMPLSLKTVNIIPKTEYSVPMYAFYGNPLVTEITLSETVTAIGAYAFAGCSSLKTVNTDAETIYKGAFSDCVSLSGFVFTEGSVIGEKAFYNTTALKTVSIPEGVVLGVNCFEKSGVITLTLNIDEVPDYCFYNCVSLNTVTANGLLKIGFAGFAYCIGLDSFNTQDHLSVNLEGVTVASRAFAYLVNDYIVVGISEEVESQAFFKI